MWVDETSFGWLGWLDASVVEETVDTQTQVGQFQPLDSRGDGGQGGRGPAFPPPSTVIKMSSARALLLIRKGRSRFFFFSLLL